MPRKALDGAKLAADVSKLEREDQISPPTAQPSLMDAVRALSGYIETRAKLGWTDPMIAAVLSKAGYPISAETLRSYRKRLREEGLMAPLPDGGRKAKIPPSAPIPSATAPPIIVAPAATPAAAAATPATARAPPDQNPPPSSARIFRVDPTKLPPDRA